MKQGEHSDRDHFSVATADIVVPGGRRPIDERHVAVLQVSMGEHGLIQRIGVTDELILVHGAHRLEAARRLGWPTIQAEVIEGDTLRLRRLEIDENISKPLRAAERARMLAELKAMRLADNPSRARGGRRPDAGAPKPEVTTPGSSKRNRQRAAGRSDNQTDNLSDDVSDSTAEQETPSFAEEMAAKTGKSPRTIEREIAVGERLTEEALDVVRGTAVEDNAAALARIAGDSTPEGQVALARGELAASRRGRKCRVDHDARRAEVARLHAAGVRSTEISRRMGIHPSLVSEILGKLGVSANSPSVKLWADLDSVASVLSGAAIRSESLAVEIAGGEVKFDKEEVRQCISRFSEALRSHRKLLGALKRKLQ